MRIVTRAEWSARPAKSAPAKVAIASRTATCTHHDGEYPVIVRTFAEACALMRRDQAYHQNHNGWADIGYNYLVISAPGASVDGLIMEGRGRDVIGAHCKDHNTPWIGIQVAVGGNQVPSPAALASTRWLHRDLEDDAAHSLAFKVHSDGFNTACPGPILRTWVHGGMQVATVSQAGSAFPTTTLEETDMPLTITDADLVVKRLLGTALGDSGMVVAKALQSAAVPPAAVDIAALAAAIVAALPAGGSNVTAADIAKAVADEQYRRQES